MAKLVLDYYKGKDLYSDGDIEKHILEAVQNRWDLLDLTEYVKPKEYYVFLYHLSLIRENILNWYPFKKGCRILEVGSGCGAITGMLCRKAAAVTSVELSRQRGEINYLRNKDLENLEIIVGNLNDLKPAADYDYIILNGVLEYACSFTEGDTPFQSFLEHIRKYLKPKGKLLLAIENRLGIKYFAGAPEDHTDRCFLGIRQYPEENSVRTFSKNELTELLRKSGFRYQRFYYPYPDYKFPSEIYTDDNINNGNYGRTGVYFEKMNRRLFHEKAMTDSLAKEKVLDKFANSFLVEAGAASPEKEHVLYAKLNTSRRREFAVGTVIRTDARGRRTVGKYALTSEAAQHIAAIDRNGNEGKYNLKGKLTEQFIEYPYLKGKNLNETAGEYIRKSEREKVADLIRNIGNTILGEGFVKKDIYSEQFVKMFGDYKIDKEFVCVSNANIDLILDNIFVSGKGYQVIDCEWFIETAVPKKFILWRMMNEVFQQNPEAEARVGRNWLMSRFQIDSVEEEGFRKWANHFAENYVSDQRLQKYLKINGIVDITDYLCENYRTSTDLYIDTGNGFSEQEKMCKDIYIDKKGEFEVVFDLSDRENIIALRWDPVDGEVVKCEDIEITIDGEPVKFKSCNGEDGIKDLFMTLDPQYLCRNVKKGSKELRIHGRMLRLSEPKNLVDVYTRDIRRKMEITVS